MIKNMKFIIKGWLVSTLVLGLLALSASAATFNITSQNTPLRNHNDDTLSSATIQAFKQVGSIDRPGANGSVADDVPVNFTDSQGSPIEPAIGNDGNIDFFGLADIAVGDIIYVRIWEGSPDSGPAAYYVDKDYKLVGKPVETVEIPGLKTNILNDIPLKPEPIYNFTELLAREALPSTEYDLQMAYSLTRPASAAPVDRYEVQVVKEISAGTWDDWPGETQADKDAEPNFFDSGLSGWTPVDDYFERGKKYQFRGRAVNHLGPSDWAEDPSYVYEALAAVIGVGGEFSFVLKASEPDKVVINSIAVPSTLVTIDSTLLANPITRVDVGTVGKLADAINRVAGAKVVTAVYKWDPTAPEGVAGATFTDQGDVETGNGDAVIVPGIGIQVYIKPGTPDIPITFTSE